jgi:hypothetical protein
MRFTRERSLVRNQPRPRPGGDAAVLPNLIVIGAQKCGTTSLHYYLSLHPDIAMSRTKELNFFTDRWHRGRRWYERQFRDPVPIRGETSPRYSFHPVYRDVPERIAGLVPDAKLVYVVGDPIERTVSAFAHQRGAGRTRLSLRDALADLDDNLFVWPSLYHHQLGRYLDRFPRERILVVAKEDLERNRRDVLRQVFRFLGVDDGFDSPEFARELNRTTERRQMTQVGRAVARVTRQTDPEARFRLRQLLVRPLSQPLERPALDPRTRARLAERLRPDIERFRATCGVAFPGWSV